MTENEISPRLLEQRLRNRIMESLHALADGEDGVRREGVAEYFEEFYDWIPHRDQENRFHDCAINNSAITADELALLQEVSAILDDAADAIFPSDIKADEFIATGWPKRIQPVAKKALEQMQKRGRFSEEKEEETPTDTL